MTSFHENSTAANICLRQSRKARDAGNAERAAWWIARAKQHMAAGAN